jgi:hypothetical protein
MEIFMKSLLTLTLLISSFMSYAKSSVVECRYLSGTKITSKFHINYELKNDEFSDAVKVELSRNSIGIENDLIGKLVKMIKNEALMPLYQDILMERQGDYDSIRIDFLFDDNLNNERYATLRYSSDGPSYAAFYRCRLQ